MEGGIDDVGLGVLFGLERYKYEFVGLLMHAEHLEAEEPKKIATFLWLIGSRAMEIYNTLFPNDGTTDGMLGTNNGNQNGNA